MLWCCWQLYAAAELDDTGGMNTLDPASWKDPQLTLMNALPRQAVSRKGNKVHLGSGVPAM